MTSPVGTYKLASRDNFDSFLEALGVSEDKRKHVANTDLSVEVSTSDDSYIVFKEIAPFKTSTIRFKVGEEYEYERLDGTKVKGTITAVGNTYTAIERDGNLESKYVQEFTSDGLISTSTVNGVASTRVYKRV